MNKDHLLQRAQEERQKIFQRYEKGRSEDNEIDPWEDPSFEIYHQTDKFGFIHDQRLPQNRNPADDREFELNLEREKKWLHMLRRWTKKDTLEKLKRRVYKGIPNKLRSAVWLKLLKVENTINANKGVYSRMLKLANKYCTETRQIDSDVNRQFREHLIYRERYSIKQQSLFNVLTAYSMYNMELGYCQGMAGLAGILLMYMDEEESFWALSIFMSDRKYAMHGLFIEGFPKLTRFLDHHDRIVAKFLPKLHKHFIKHNLDSILYSLKWFFVIFVERIPFSLCLRIWDIYMIEGETVVTAMAFTILRLHHHKLLKMKDMDLMTDFLQTQLHNNFGFDDDYVIRALEHSMISLKKHKLDLPPPPKEHEFPQHPLGKFVEPDFDAKIGLRKSIFTETERKTTENVILRQTSIPTDAVSNYSCNTDDTMACLTIEDSSSLLSSSAARTSIVSTNRDCSEISGGDSFGSCEMELDQQMLVKTVTDLLIAHRPDLESM